MTCKFDHRTACERDQTRQFWSFCVGMAFLLIDACSDHTPDGGNSAWTSNKPDVSVGLETSSRNDDLLDHGDLAADSPDESCLDRPVDEIVERELADCDEVSCAVNGGGRLVLCGDPKITFSSSSIIVKFVAKCGPVSVIGVRWEGDKGLAAYFHFSKANSGGYAGYYGSYPYLELEIEEAVEIAIEVLESEHVCGTQGHSVLTVGYTEFPTTDTNPNEIFETQPLELIFN